MFKILSRSSKWYEIRYRHLLQQNCCQACGSKKRLQVHHIIPFHVDNSKELDLDNLITMCQSCHFVFGHLMDWQSWNTEVINDSKVYYNKIVNKPFNIQGQSYEKSTIGDYFCSLFYKLLWWYNRS